MYDNYHYPPGADTPDAPWNEVSIPERDFDVLISQTLSKSTTVTTDDYIPDYDEETGHTDVDTSETDWKEAYDSNHYTPAELLEEFADMLMKRLNEPDISMADRRKYKRLLDECQEWEVDETEIVEE